MTEFTLADLRPTEVETYLHSRAWRLLRHATHGNVWVTSIANDELDVFVPRETGFADYGRRLLDLVRTISQAEHRPEQEILRDLVEVSADVIRFRLPYAFPDDSVPLSEAMTILQRARESLRAAALSTIEARPVYPSKAPAKVEALLETFRLGQTERGSFVVPVISPLGTVEAGVDELIPRTDEPFARHVAVRFARALAAVGEAITAARSQNELTPFSAAIPDGVSANLCTAVGEMASVVGRYRDSAEGVPELSIRFSWSPTRPIKPDVPNAFAVPREDAAILGEAAGFLKALTPRPRVTITGQVIRLERDESQPDGSIGIKGEIDGADRTVVVRLSADDYARALHAHELRLAVTCSGVLEQRGTHAILEGLVDFSAPERFFDNY